MEAKRFGVKTTLLKELRLFQSSLKKKRKLYFDVELKGSVGSVQTRIMTGEGRVVIEGLYPFHVRQEHYSELSPTQVSLVVFMGITEFKLKFESPEHKEMFQREISEEWTPSPPREN